MNLLPKIKVEIVIYETPLDTLIDTIREMCIRDRDVVKKEQDKLAEFEEKMKSLNERLAFLENL